MPDSPAATLTAAATLLRKRAIAATQGPWVPSIVRSPRATVTSGIYSHAHPAGSAASEVAAAGRKGRECGGVANPDNAEYIALMHPDVGLALAEWLGDAAEGDEHGEHNPYALAVARQILGQVTE